jgi:predicted nucleotidyltransferase
VGKSGAGLLSQRAWASNIGSFAAGTQRPGSDIDLAFERLSKSLPAA